MRLFSGSESTVCLCKTPSEDRRFPSPVPSSCTAFGVVIQAVFPGARCGSVCGVTSWHCLGPADPARPQCFMFLLLHPELD